MEHRTHPRHDVTGIRLLSVSIHAEGFKPISATILDTSSHGLAAVVLHSHDQQLPLEQQVRLTVVIGSEEYTLQARVSSFVEGDSTDRYGFQFLNPGELDSDIHSEFVRRVFDRRIAPRVAFEADEQVAITLVDEQQGVTVQGWMSDVSTVGGALELALSDAIHRDETAQVRAEFKLPGQDHAIRLHGALHSRRSFGDSAGFAVVFDQARLPDAAREAILDLVSHRVYASGPVT